MPNFLHIPVDKKWFLKDLNRTKKTREILDRIIKDDHKKLLKDLEGGFYFGYSLNNLYLVNSDYHDFLTSRFNRMSLTVVTNKTGYYNV